MPSKGFTIFIGADNADLKQKIADSKRVVSDATRDPVKFALDFDERGLEKKLSTALSRSQNQAERQAQAYAVGRQMQAAGFDVSQMPTDVRRAMQANQRPGFFAGAAGFIRAGASAYAMNAALDTAVAVNNISRYGRQSGIGGVAGLEGQVGALESAKALPIVGHVIGVFDELDGATRNLKATIDSINKTYAEQVKIASMSGSPLMAARFGAVDSTRSLYKSAAITFADTKFGEGRQVGLSPEAMMRLRETKAELLFTSMRVARELRVAGQQQEAQIGETTARRAGFELENQAIQAEQKGDVRGAFVARQAAQYRAMQARWQAALVGKTGQGLELEKAAQFEEGKLFGRNVQQAVMNMEPLRGEAVSGMSAIAAGEVGRARMATMGSDVGQLIRDITGKAGQYDSPRYVPTNGEQQQLDELKMLNEKITKMLELLGKLPPN